MWLHCSAPSFSYAWAGAGDQKEEEETPSEFDWKKKRLMFFSPQYLKRFLEYVYGQLLSLVKCYLLAQYNLA